MNNRKLVLLGILGWLLLVKPGAVDAANSGFTRGYLGIGLKTEEDWITIGIVAADSPASRAGLRGGERVLKVNGKSTETKSLMEAGSWLAGPAGENVTLTLLRPNEPGAQPFEVTLTRVESKPELRRPQAILKRYWARPPTKEAGPVEWENGKITSRVLPYPDFISFFIRLPIAHAVSTGKGVKVAVVDASEQQQQGVTLTQNVAPGAEVSGFTGDTNQADAREILGTATNAGWKVVLVSNPSQYQPGWLKNLVEEMSLRRVLVVVSGDQSENGNSIEAVNKAHELGALVVGRVSRQSMLMAEMENERGSKPFNLKIKEIEIDVFSTASLFGEPPVAAAATAAGVAALILEKFPQATPADVRRRIIAGARQAWQAVSIETSRMSSSFNIDPITTEYVPRDEKAIYRFRVLDAAGALEVDTAIPWFLNMLNCHKAWEVSRAEGVLVAVTDQGFHLKHPQLAGRIQETKCFGPVSFDAPEMNFHGTDMSRILLAVAPGAKLLPVLCSGSDYTANGDLAANIAKSFVYAAEKKADVVSSSWSATFASNSDLLRTIRETVDKGVLVSWFHYPRAYAGVIRPAFTYAGGWSSEDRLGFPDRFLVDPPGFHPVEIEAGLSATSPQAAGIAALVRGINRKLTPAQIEQIIYQTGSPIGGGIIVPDAFKAVITARDRNA